MVDEYALRQRRRVVLADRGRLAGSAVPRALAAVIRRPKVNGPRTTVAECRQAFENDHVHAVLVVDRGVLLAVVERADVVAAGPRESARSHGRLSGRTVGPEVDVESLRQSMADMGRRRLAVVDADGVLVGLLCLKRSGRGFCSDDDVAARAREREAGLE